LHLNWNCGWKATNANRTRIMKKAQRKSEVVKRFGPALRWNDWTRAITSTITYVILGMKEKRLNPPVEATLTSAHDDPLVSFRMNRYGEAPICLQADEPRWQDPTIFPVRVTIVDGAGNLDEWLCSVDRVN
jgi:hypothetical protein